VEDGWNNLRKIIFEAADGVLGERVRSRARNISEIRNRIDMPSIC